MSRAGSPFSARAVLAVLVVGAAAFLLLLYAIGAGWDGGNDKNGGAHAAANGLNGFAGLLRLLDEQGYDVSVSRSEARFDEESLLVLTPELDADGDAIADIISQRRYVGPTLLILPKWIAIPASMVPNTDAPQGWVMLTGVAEPDWLGSVENLEEVTPAAGEHSRWEGLGLSGALPDPDNGLALLESSVANKKWTSVLPLITDEDGDLLAGYLNDDGAYKVLDGWSGYSPSDDPDEDIWPVVIVAEPDLLNNYGLANRERAEAAVKLIDASLDGYDLPIVFDLTAAGLGESENLMTLAFRPPFLAATLCLLFAALVIAWRAFRRFGPPVAEAPALAMGKRQLARNGAALVERARRVHLLAGPYAALVGARIAEKLGIREADPEARDAAIARVLAERGLAPDYAERADALRRARHPAELLRAAGALRTIERTLTP